MGYRTVIVGILTLALVLVVGFAAQRRTAAPVRGASVVAALSADDRSAGFERAFAPRDLTFPADHGPHPTFQTEWWYYTGNLDSPEGRHFGYQLTFFRRALRPQPVERASDWATNQVVFAHFTVSDVAGGAFYPAERFSRGAVGLAGAQAEPFRVWLEDWSARGDVSGTVRLRAAQEQVAIDLEVRLLKPPALQGDRGLSQKSAEPGNASYYYSLTRLETQGTVTVNGQSFAVRGLSWMDREWSTSALNPGVAGWDWFSLQLDDGRELMLYQLRRVEGGVEPQSSGSLIDGEGRVQPLSISDFQIAVLDTWTSPRTGAEYPARWRVVVPVADLDLTVTPYLADQELPLSFAYWEGAAQVMGESAGTPIAGRGYVELTGYATGGEGRYSPGAATEPAADP